MPTTLKYPARCLSCGQHMAIGSEAHWVPKDDGGYDYAHLECPSAPEPRTYGATPTGTPPFVSRACDRCGTEYALKPAPRRSTFLGPCCARDSALYPAKTADGDEGADDGVPAWLAEHWRLYNAEKAAA